LSTSSFGFGGVTESANVLLLSIGPAILGSSQPWSRQLGLKTWRFSLLTQLLREMEKRMSLVLENQINSKGLREQVADILRTAIFEGKFKPGELLKDSALATQFKVSRSPVREALLQLEKESLVRNFHNRGWYVIELTLAEISEIVGLRVVLEVLALKLAARNVKKKELERLAIIQEKLMQTFWREDWKNAMCDVVKMDFEFHHCIWRISNHHLLEETLVRTTRPYFAYMQAIIRSMVSSPEQYREQHEGAYRSHESLINYLAKSGELSPELCVCQHLLAPSMIEGWDHLVRNLPSEIVGDVRQSSGNTLDPSDNP
jgi:DNA-binding GntR family transcriptional regulator